jgi:hypothetical protein
MKIVNNGIAIKASPNPIVAPIYIAKNRNNRIQTISNVLLHYQKYD